MHYRLLTTLSHPSMRHPCPKFITNPNLRHLHKELLINLDHLKFDVLLWQHQVFALIVDFRLPLRLSVNLYFILYKISNQFSKKWVRARARAGILLPISRHFSIDEYSTNIFFISQKPPKQWRNLPSLPSPST